MIKYSRYLALFFILVLTLPGVFAPTSSDLMKSHALSSTAADLPPIDLPIQISQEFDGYLNQSIEIPGNDSLVPYRVDVNVTNLNSTSNRLLNGDFTNDIADWQIPTIQGQAFEVNSTGPQGARSLEANFTGIWNTTKIYPLNATNRIDQFDDPGQWTLTPGVNVTTTIDNDAISDFMGNYLNISWWTNRPDFSDPHIGFDFGSASRSFLYNGTDHVNAATIQFDYNANFDQVKIYLNPNATIKCNVSVTNPSAETYTFENAIDVSYGDAVGTPVHVILSSDIASIFGEWGQYTFTFSTSINQWNIGMDPDNIKSRLLIDNVSVEVNSSIGLFKPNEATNFAQTVSLSHQPLNDTKMTVSYCASAVPDRINHSNMQLGFAINATWFNLSALSDLTPYAWVEQSIWVGKGNFTGTTASFKVGLRSFNASELFPNETLLLYFTNITLDITSLVTGAEININLEETTKHTPLAILGDIAGNLNASIDYGILGGFGLGTTIWIHVNSSVGGGVHGQITVFSWTWREALWRSLNTSLSLLDAYIATLPNTYAGLFSSTQINFTHINFAQAMAGGDYYLARTYATQVGPNALYTTSIVNSSLRLLWPSVGDASLGEGVPDRIYKYVNETFNAQKNPRSLVPFLQSDPRWGWVQSNATVARAAIHATLGDAQAKVPLYINASTLIDWAGTLHVSLNSCISGESWIIPESTWAGGNSQLFTIGYSKMAASNLQRSIKPAYPILTTTTQFVGGTPLLATLAQSTNVPASWNYLTQGEFHFVAYFDAIVGYLAECTGIARLLESIPLFISEGTSIPASKYQFETEPIIDILFSSDHLGSPNLAITTSWKGNASITSAWIVNSLYALSPSAPVLLWEQGLPVENLTGSYTRTIHWSPPVLPPALNELYVDTWAQNWTAPIGLRSSLWVGGREVFMNMSIQQDASEKWFNISGFTTETGEEGSPLNVSQINQTQQAGDWCLLSSIGAGPQLEFLETGGMRIGYNPWGVFYNGMGSNATYIETGGFLNLLTLRGAWGGDLCVIPSPFSNSQYSVGQVITKFDGIAPYFAGVSNGTLFVTPIMGKTTFNLTLPAWEGTRTSAITSFNVEAQIISQSDPDIAVTETQVPGTISLASFTSIILQFKFPSKPIGQQFELLLTLSGNAEGGIPIRQEFKITVEFVDVISPQPPIPDSLFLALLAIVGSIAIAFFVVRWHKFIFFRRVIREEPRSFKG